MTIPDDKRNFVDELLVEPLIARMATADSSGQPHVVPVWYAWDGECIWISSYSNTRKIGDLNNNPKISVVVDVTGAKGETRAVVIEGTAALIKEPRDFLREKFYWIYTRYLGEEGVLAPDPQGWIEDPHNLLIKLAPEKVFTWQF